MTMMSFFSPDKKGYYEALDTDSVWLHFKDEAILVTPSPGSEYAYNFSTNLWEKTELSVRKIWEALRNQMLQASAWLIGDDSPLSNAQQLEFRQWRINTCNMFNLPPAEVTKPVYPSYVLPWM